MDSVALLIASILELTHQGAELWAKSDAYYRIVENVSNIIYFT